MGGQWQHGLFGCFDNLGICIISYFVPCYQFGKNAEAMGESCLLYGLGMFIPLLDIYLMVTLRGKIRDSKGIEGSCMGDLVTWCICGICALVQEAQEVQDARGAGMAIERE